MRWPVAAAASPLPRWFLPASPPIIANATNTFAATFGYITGVIGYRKHMVGYWRDLAWQMPLAFIGGLIGGWALLQTDLSFSRLPCRGCFYWQRYCSWRGRNWKAPPCNWAERG